MSVDGSVTIEWGGDEYKFRLAIGEMRELFELINRPRIAMGAPFIGPMTLLTNLQTANAWPHEVREVIRIALIGGGMKNDRALVLIKRYVEPPGHLLAACMVAAGALTAAMTTVENEETVGKDQPADERAETSTGSTSPRSTAPVLQ